MLNTYLCCFFIGFLIDKISIFPFVLGFAAGMIVSNNSDIYNMIKFPIENFFQRMHQQFEENDVIND